MSGQVVAIATRQPKPADYNAKIALKNLLTSEEGILGFLYSYHEKFNRINFIGKLSVPLITIERLNNKTLGCYLLGKNRLHITNHIQFNQDFIELNSKERILETLKHEMIHQWQDEVLYHPNGQKKRPKCWHNLDFIKKAKEIGIAYPGTPAEMPESKGKQSNKYVCGCRNDKGKPLALRVAWELDAVCNVCGLVYRKSI